MAKGLFKLLLLIVLSTGAASLPNFLGGNMAALSGGSMAGLLGTGGSSEEAVNLKRELADLPRTIESLKNLGQENTSQLAGLSAEERQMMLDAAPSLKFKSNKLTRSLGLVSGQGKGRAAVAGAVAAGLFKKRTINRQTFPDFRGSLLDFYDRHQAGVAMGLWLAPTMAAVFSFMLFVFKRYTLSMSLTGMIFLLSSFVIWSLSIAVVLSTVLTKQSLLPALPRDLWLAPVVFLVVSSGLMRLVDENYPFWNRTITTLFTPIAASCLATGWAQAGGFIKMLLASRGRFLKT